MSAEILDIKLKPTEYHLFNGGWKIHHIVSDEIFKSKKWDGMIIHSSKNLGSVTTHGKIETQDFELIPANQNESHYWKIRIDSKEVITCKRFSTEGQELLVSFIKNEGLTPYEFHNKKFNLHARDFKYFSGKIVHFTQFKYHL